MYIILSPYKPHHNGNVGARLVEQSAINLMREVREEVEVNVHHRREDFTSRLEYLNSAKAIVIPNFHMTERARPKLYRIAKDLEKVEPPIIPVNGFYKFKPEIGEQIEQQRLDRETKQFLEHVKRFCPREELPSRSEYVATVLEQSGYDSRLVGDPGWYDPEYIGNTFHKPSQIDQLVFTPPHDPFYTEQAKQLLRRLARAFEDADKIISCHCAWDPMRSYEPNEELAAFGSKFGWETKYTSHELSNIDFYKESDLHVGYLKHGHLAHLRWRIPSVVLAEDSRAVGLNKTLGTAGFPAFSYPRFGEKTTAYIEKYYNSKPFVAMKLLTSSLILDNIFPDERSLVSEADKNIPERVVHFVNEQQANSWEAYDSVGKRFDKTYKKEMIPYLDEALPE